MTELYIPKGGISLDTVEWQQIRLGIQGPPGEGKTYSATTFPNPVVLNIDKGLGAHVGRKDIIEIPFWNPAFVSQWATNKPGEAPNRRDALKKWIASEGPKLVEEQTLVIDGVTGWETAFDTEERKYPVHSSSGEENKFIFWRNKLEYFQELFESLKFLKCHVIVISHEQVERNSKGDLTGKIKPIFTGQFGDKLVSHMTDHFRMICGDKKSEDKIDENTLRAWGFKTKIEYIEMQKSFIGNAIYGWQTEGDDLFSAKAGSLVNCPKYIPATFQSFLKYKRKIQIPS